MKFLDKKGCVFRSHPEALHQYHLFFRILCSVLSTFYLTYVVNFLLFTNDFRGKLREISFSWNFTH